MNKPFAYILVFFFSLISVAPLHALRQIADVPVTNAWDLPLLWEMGTDGISTATVCMSRAKYGSGLEVSYSLKNEGWGWVELKNRVMGRHAPDIPLVFLIKAQGDASLEIKFVDTDGSTFLKKVPLRTFAEWTQVAVYQNSLEYGWGGDGKMNALKEVRFAIAGNGSGTVFLDEIGYGPQGTESSFAPAGPQLDPKAKLPGIGFEQRRASALLPEDPHVLEWLKQVQDTSSPEKQLLPSMEDSRAQTFNNALAAMAFLLKGERERAERILDFYSNATLRENTDLSLQNFFYKGQPRGFYQNVLLSSGTVPAYHEPGGSDRWIGDMAWLLIAYNYYAKTFTTDKYKDIAALLKELMLSYYKTDVVGGYVQHGWRKSDSKLHERDGHPEGNIDCCAALLLSGETKYAENIKKWLDATINGHEGLPLDLYTWRAMTNGKKSAPLLDMIDFDFRYRKQVIFSSNTVMGVFHGPDADVQNIWFDGVGHMACAYFAVGNLERGCFYANQLDPFLIERTMNGVTVKALPYTMNTEGGYEWVDTKKGFVSTAAWYIFAKNGFNPLTLQKVEGLKTEK